MGDGSLTQEEIDALLQGADDFTSTPAVGDEGGGDSDSVFSPSEMEVLSENLLQSLTSGSGSLSAILNKSVQFTNAFMEVVSLAKLQEDYGGGYVSLHSQLAGDVSGNSHILIPVTDAVKIAGHLMGMENASGSELDGAQEQTLKDTMSPMISGYFAYLAGKINSNLSSGPIKILHLNQPDDLKLPEGEDYARVVLNFKIADLCDTKLIQIFPLNVANTIVRSAMRSSQAGGQASGASAGGAGMAPGGSGQPGMGAGMAAGKPSVQADDVEFQELQTTHTPEQSPNLDLLMDIKMDLTVELGRTRKYVKEVLGLGEGSIIELDKLAGEPVDLLVNNKLIARGEVVVIDENFGVRVTDIVRPEERLKGLKGEG